MEKDIFDDELDQNLVDLLEERLEEVVMIAANKKDWPSFKKELAIVLTSFAAQVVKEAGFDEENALLLFEDMFDADEEVVEILNVSSNSDPTLN